MNTEEALELIKIYCQEGGPENTNEWFMFLTWLRRGDSGLNDSDRIALVSESFNLGDTYYVDVISSILSFHKFGDEFDKFIRTLEVHWNDSLKEFYQYCKDINFSVSKDSILKKLRDSEFIVGDKFLVGYGLGRDSVVNYSAITLHCSVTLFPITTARALKHSKKEVWEYLIPLSSIRTISTFGTRANLKVGRDVVINPRKVHMWRCNPL